MTLKEHLFAIDACAPAIVWAGNRTAQQAWDECERPDHLIWWVVRTRPEWRQRAVLLIVRELRARTLDRAGALRDVAAAALDAAEAWALDPCEETCKAAAYAAAHAADSAYAAAHACKAAAYAAADSAYAAAHAAYAAYAADSAYAAAHAAHAADSACAAAHAAHAAHAVDAAYGRQLWLAAIRAEFECPWREDDAR